MNGVGESQWSLTRVVLIVARIQWNHGAHVFQYPLVQQVWRYDANILWQFFAKKRNFWSLEILLNGAISL